MHKQLHVPSNGEGRRLLLEAGDGSRGEGADEVCAGGRDDGDAASAENLKRDGGGRNGV